MTKGTGRRFVILWVEDELIVINAGVDVLRKLLAEQLKIGEGNLEIVEAGTMEVATQELAKRRETLPDLMLLDLMLPRNRRWAESDPPRIDMNAGFFLWHRLRKQKEWGDRIASVPIVVVTARGNPEFLPAMQEDAKLAWVGKPVGPNKLAESILTLLRNEHIPLLAEEA